MNVKNAGLNKSIYLDRERNSALAETLLSSFTSSTKMFGEAKGFFDGLAAVFDTADTTVATIVWNAVLEKKKLYPQHNEIDLTFDQQKIEAHSASDLKIIWHKK